MSSLEETLRRSRRAQTIEFCLIAVIAFCSGVGLSLLFSAAFH